MPVRALLLIAATYLFPCCAPADGRTSVLLVTVDTTRADRLHSYGNERIETPHLDRLAREGVRFERAYTAVPSTLPSHATILTGVYPARHGVHDNGVYALPAQAETLTERFQEAGYRTGAFVSAFVLDAQFGLAQGFETYDDRMRAPLIEADPVRLKQSDRLSEDRKRWLIQLASPYQRRADEVTPLAIEWLAEGGDQPFFLWVHYFDPHMDYTPRAPWSDRYDPDYEGELDGRSKTYELAAMHNGWSAASPLPPADRDHMIALYDGEISYMDAWIGRLLDALEDRGELDDALVVVVGDHGEGFGEHGQFWEHNGQIFDEVMRVPLIVKLPANASAGRVVPELVRTIDVAPTVLEAVELAPIAGVQGISLLPLARGEAGAPRPDAALLEAGREQQATPSDYSWLGLVSDRSKLVILYDSDGKPVRSIFFDLAMDPLERRPLAPMREGMLEAWRERANQLYADSSTGASAFRGIDRMTSEALRSLGYLGAD
jgi:arylsulfatase A-like enzyme